jgi:hypothetical protein
MKKILSMLFLAGTMVFAISCGGDENPDAPTATAPSLTEVEVGTDVELTFTISASGGFKSASVTATGGTAVVTTPPAAGAKTGSAVVTFTAGETAGAGSVELTVVDESDQSVKATAVLNIKEEPVKPMVDVFASGEGTGSVTWTADNIYVLRGFIFVNDGQTLTIEPGTVVKGQPGQGAGASALIVAKGGKLIAEGTASDPIIFTGLADDLEGSVPEDATGLWGGIIMLGKASTNNTIDDPAEGVTSGERAIEGIPETEERGVYGTASPNDADNSGSLKYVSIRHGGSSIGADNEINGLTL